MCVALDCCSHLKCITGTYISTFGIRAAQSAKHYRETADEINHVKGQVAELRRQLESVNKKLTNNKTHQTSIKKHRAAANQALTERNVALTERNVAKDHLKAVEQERDRWQTKYVVCVLR